MRIKLYILILSLFITICAIAKTNPMARMMASKIQVPMSRDDEQEETETPYIPLLIKVYDDAVADHLVEMGVVIYNRRNDILLASVPKEMYDSIESMPTVYAQTMGCVNTLMDVARKNQNIDIIHQGSQPFDSAFDGSGVVVGISDIGFDAKHIAFKNNLVALHDYSTLQGTSKSATTPEEIAAWTTDRPDNFHATHVANILAGSWDDGSGTPDGQYYGVAPGAELVVTTSDLYDSGILAGVEDVIAYAKSVGKPAVINLSLGSTCGPHDGTDLVCQYLSACAEDAVICLSAGNDGTRNMLATQLIDEMNPLSRFFVKDRYSGSATTCSGFVDIWGDTSEPFDVRIDIYDCDLQKIVYEGKWMSDITAMDEDSVMVVSPETDAQWGKVFSGTAKAGCELNPFNNRFNVLLQFNMACDIVSDRGNWSKYHPAVSLRRLHGGEIRFNAFSGNGIVLGGLKDTPIIISNDGSISNLCTAPGVISVGMYQTRTDTPLWPDGEYHWSDEPLGNVSKHSSFSSGNYNLEKLPHFCAPGAYVVSAYSRYHLASEDGETRFVRVDSFGDDQYHWIAELGTSMSSPFAAGIFALWLEANPSLTPQELLQIAIDTADTDVADPFTPQYGYGYINAAAGLSKIISEYGGIASTIEADPKLDVTTDRRIVVTMPDGTVPSYRVYSIQGASMPIRNAFMPGIYIVDIPGYKTQKIYVK